MAEPDSQILLAAQKNSLFTSIQLQGLSPSDFACDEIPDTHSVRVRYKGTRYRFLIEVGEDRFHEETYFTISRSPGLRVLSEHSRCTSWNDVRLSFDLWLTSLISELETPDLWATVSGDAQLINLADDQDNRPFTPQEQLQVTHALNEIKTYLIQAQRLTEEQTKTIEARFAYMEEAASRLGRKDWMNILIGNLIGIVSTLSLSADSTKDLFRFAGHIVKQFLGTMLYLAGPH